MCSNLTQSWDFDTPEAEALDEGMMLRRSVDAAGRPAGRKQKPPWGLEPAVPEVPLTKSNAGFHRRGGGGRWGAPVDGVGGFPFQGAVRFLPSDRRGLLWRPPLGLCQPLPWALRRAGQVTAGAVEGAGHWQPINLDLNSGPILP